MLEAGASVRVNVRGGGYEFRGCVNYNDFHLGLWLGLAIGYG